MALIETMSAEFLQYAMAVSAGYTHSGSFGVTSAGIRGQRVYCNFPIERTNFGAPFATAGSLTVGFAIAHNVWAGATEYGLFKMLVGTTESWSVVSYSGGIRLKAQNATVLASTTSPGFVDASAGSAGPYYYLEIQTTIEATPTTIIRVNGTQVLSHTGSLGTHNADTYNSVSFGFGAGQSSLMDLYILNSTGSTNTTFLGDCRVECLWPVAAGAHDTWTLGLEGGSSATTKAQALNRTYGNDGNNSYARTAVVGDRQTFTLDDLASTTGTVRGLTIAQVGRGEVNAGAKLSASVRSGGTTTDGTAFMTVPNASFGHAYFTRELNPSTGLLWTASEINALEAGPLVLAP